MVARAGKTAAPLASLAALGVVFGVGTSPLYALSTSFELAHDQVDKVVVYGTTSMVIWAITLVVTVLYVGILLRFDNEGKADCWRCSHSCGGHGRRSVWGQPPRSLPSSAQPCSSVTA